MRVVAGGCEVKMYVQNNALNSRHQVLLKVRKRCLPGVAQWIECWPVNQKVTISIPSQGTCLCCGPGPQFRVCERQPHIDVSLPLPLSLKVSK